MELHTQSRASIQMENKNTELNRRNVISYQAYLSHPFLTLNTKFPVEDADIGTLHVSVEHCHTDEKFFI